MRRIDTPTIKTGKILVSAGTSWRTFGLPFAFWFSKEDDIYKFASIFSIGPIEIYFAIEH